MRSGPTGSTTMRDRYRSVGPYLTVYEWADGHTEAWNDTDLAEAICHFWQDHHLSHPVHRCISDSTGRAILIEVDRQHTGYAFAATRETWSRTVASCSTEGLAEQAMTMKEARCGQ